jgi:hypothetical protein
MRIESIVILCDGCGKQLLVSCESDIGQDWDDVATKNDYVSPSDDLHYCDQCAPELEDEAEVVVVNATNDEIDGLCYWYGRYRRIVGLAEPEDEDETKEVAEDSVNYPLCKCFLQGDCLKFVADQAGLPYAMVSEFVEKMGDKDPDSTLVVSELTD